MPKFLQRLVTAAFVLFLLAAGGATLLRDKENVSFFENRALAAQPTYTAQSDGALLPYIPEESVTREEIAAQADAMAEQLAVIRSAVEGYGGYF